MSTWWTISNKKVPDSFSESSAVTKIVPESHLFRISYLVHEVAHENNIKRLKELIKENHPLDNIDKYGQTPLDIAINNCHGEIVELLIKAGVPLHLQDDKQHDSPGNLPLHKMLHLRYYFTEKHGINAFNAMIAKGPYFNQKDSHGKNPFFYALHLSRIGVSFVKQIEVIRAILNGMIVQKNNENVCNIYSSGRLKLFPQAKYEEILNETQIDGENIFFHALNTHHFDTLRALFEFHGNINQIAQIQDRKGTSFWYAAFEQGLQHNQAFLCDYLLKNGFISNTFPFGTKRNQTILHLVVQYGSLKWFEQIHQWAGSTIDELYHPDEGGKFPAHYALEINSEELFLKSIEISSIDLTEPVNWGPDQKEQNQIYPPVVWYALNGESKSIFKLLISLLQLTEIEHLKENLLYEVMLSGRIGPIKTILDEFFNTPSDVHKTFSVLVKMKDKNSGKEFELNGLAIENLTAVFKSYFQHLSPFERSVHFYEVVKNGNIVLVKYFLSLFNENFLEINPYDANGKAKPIFFHALSSGHYNIAKLLLTKPWLNLPWDTIIKSKNIFIFALELGDVDMMDMLIEKRQSQVELESISKFKEERYPKNNSTLLHLAIERFARFVEADATEEEIDQHHQMISLLIKKFKFSVHEKDSLGMEAIHSAAKVGDVSTMELLLINCDQEPKVTVNDKSETNLRPLHYAYESGSDEAVKFLITQEEINVVTAGQFNTSTLHYATVSKLPSEFKETHIKSLFEEKELRLSDPNPAQKRLTLAQIVDTKLESYIQHFLEHDHFIERTTKLVPLHVYNSNKKDSTIPHNLEIYSDEWLDNNEIIAMSIYSLMLRNTEDVLNKLFSKLINLFKVDPENLTEFRKKIIENSLRRFILKDKLHELPTLARYNFSFSHETDKAVKEDKISLKPLLINILIDKSNHSELKRQVINAIQYCETEKLKIFIEQEIFQHNYILSHHEYLFLCFENTGKSKLGIEGQKQHLHLRNYLLKKLYQKLNPPQLITSLKGRVSYSVPAKAHFLAFHLQFSLEHPHIANASMRCVRLINNPPLGEDAVKDWFKGYSAKRYDAHSIPYGNGHVFPLPADGKIYFEFDLDPKIDTELRNRERLLFEIVEKKWYYTKDHYNNFVPFKPMGPEPYVPGVPTTYTA